MSVDDSVEGFGEVGNGIDVVEPAGGHDGREQRPIFGSDFMASKQSIFSGQAYWPDGVFDRVGVEFEPPVVEEAGEPFPMSKTITDVFGQL